MLYPQQFREKWRVPALPCPHQNGYQGGYNQHIELVGNADKIRPGYEDVRLFQKCHAKAYHKLFQANAYQAQKDEWGK